MKKRWANDAEYDRWVMAWDAGLLPEYQMVQATDSAKLLSCLGIAYILLACATSTIVPYDLTFLFSAMGSLAIMCAWFAMWEGFHFKRIVDEMRIIIDRGIVT